MTHTAWADINLAALSHNLATVKALAPQSRVVAMIKADAYGHGLTSIATAIADTADKLGVARFEEAEKLRAEGIRTPLLLMGTLLDSAILKWCASNDTAVAIHTESQLALLTDVRLPKPLEVWLKADTGMNRLGLNAAQFQRALTVLHNDSRFRLKTMTHFSSADEADSDVTEGQIQRFLSLTRGIRDVDRSLANSAGIIGWPQSHADWVRPGIMLYGDNPSPHIAADLRPVMSLRAKVISTKDVAAGEAVGYGATWTAPAPTRIAALGIGYGDGYPRQLKNGCPVAINGQIFPLVGRVSMDICSVDIGSAQSEIGIGDIATLWGDDIPAAEVARRADTISYHLFTGITPRVPRHYLSSS